MAGSRTEAIGSIFTRVRGLLRAGALKEINKPLWYEVYEAFPPGIEPKVERDVQDKPPVNILYREDFVRAKFYQTYGSPDIIDMTDARTPSISQRFIQQYNELRNRNPEENDEQLFKGVASSLATEGVNLRTLTEINQEKEARKKEYLAKKQKAETEPGPISVTDIFGKSIKPDDPSDGDYLDEDVIELKEPKDT